MKVTCIRDGLLTACQLTQAAVKPNSTKPILMNIAAFAQDDALILMATDLEVGIRYELRGVKVHRAGSAILPVSRLIAILRETQDGEITLDSTTEQTKIKLSNGKYELPGGDPQEFPEVPPFESGERYHEVKAGQLKSMIKRVAFAAEKKESTRWAVTGILWEAEHGKIRLVATDTKRLAMMEGPAEIFGDETPVTGSHLVPLKAIQLLERNLNDEGEVIRIALRANEALFQTERAMIHTRLVEGRFPPYRDIIPKKLTIKLSLSVAEFLARVRQAAIMTDEESKRVDFAFEPGQLTLTARGASTGASEVVMNLPDYTEAKIDMAFDPQYLTEMLRSIEEEPTVTMEMMNKQKAVLFKLGESYVYLVMPLVD